MKPGLPWSVKGIEPDVREPTLIKTVRLGGYMFTPTVELG